MTSRLPIQIHHFADSEFNSPALMDEEFLRFLEAVRIEAGIPFYITSDYRDANPNSLHASGRALDFVVRPWSRENLARVNRAVVLSAEVEQYGYEWELVQGPTDKHLHLGLFEDLRDDRLILALD